MNIYIINSLYVDDLYYLISEEGEIFNKQISHNSLFAWGDLYDNQPKIKQQLIERFNNNWKVDYWNDRAISREELRKRYVNFYFNQ